MKLWPMLLALVASAVHSQPVSAPALDPLIEQRYCGPPKRDVNGGIIRSSAVLAAFRRVHPCPATGLMTGICTGWAMDHVVPLASGGCDAVSNLQWLPLVLKSCACKCKDRWERKVYESGIMIGSVDLSACL